jgi:hypothetical protein
MSSQEEMFFPINEENATKEFVKQGVTSLFNQLRPTKEKGVETHEYSYYQ